MSQPWPLEIRLSKDRSMLTLQYDNNETRRHSAHLLRLQTPSAQKRPPVVSEGITITDVEPVGNYAVRLVFDDGHKTGLYTWDYLYALN